MALEGLKKSEPTAAFAATVAIKGLPRFSPTDLVVRINALLAGTGVQAGIDTAQTEAEPDLETARFWHRPKSPPRIALAIDDVRLTVEGHDRVPFEREELRRLDMRSWPEGRTHLARARASVTVTETSGVSGAGIDTNYDRATALTIVVAAAAQLVEAIGVVWQPSRCAVPATELPELVAELGAGRAPVSLWLGCRHYPARLERPQSTVTQGLGHLLGIEIEVAVPELAPEKAINIILEATDQILQEGSVPAEGSFWSLPGAPDLAAVYRTNGLVPVLTLSPAERNFDEFERAGAA